MKTGKTVEADIMQVLYNKFPYETLSGLLSLVLGFFLYNVNAFQEWWYVTKMTTYQHDGKTGEMGGVTVGLVPSRGHGSYPLRGPP